MLRATRDARKVHHPHASYAGDNLSCILCRTVIKVEGQWDSHIRSPQHTERLKITKNAESGLPNRKRKAEDRNSEQDEVKRSRVASAEPEAEQVAETGVLLSEQQPVAQDESKGEDHLDVNDEEWDAFERDLKGLESTGVQLGLPHVATGAVISAAPLKAEDLAAQAREAQSQQRGARDEELEAEDEDAAARTNEEAEEMDRLQERMRQLREKREALRKLVPATGTAMTDGMATDQIRDSSVSNDFAADNDSDDEENDDDDDGDGEDGADEWENFGFRR